MNSVGLKRFATPLVVSFALAAVALLLFAELAEEMLEGDTRQFDLAVRQLIHARASPGLTATMRFLTLFGSVLFVSVAALCTSITLWITGRHHRALLIAITVGGGSLLMMILKIAFHRARPEPFFDTPMPDSYSFPSGHALVSACFYGAAAALSLAHEKRRWVNFAIWTLAIVLILAIGISRVYLGVHYPSDVLSGYLAALVWVLGISIAYRKLARQSPREDAVK